VVGVDASRRLAELDAGGIRLLAPSTGLTAGADVRVRIPAREVILATDAPSGLSVHNVLTGTLTGLDVNDETGVAIVRLAVGHACILAEVAKDAVARLDISQGARVHALIKSVSLEVLVTSQDR
jgi:molybdate transport system ATP-binding protein